jgi:hypothetical protein
MAEKKRGNAAQRAESDEQGAARAKYDTIVPIDLEQEMKKSFID